MLGLVIITLTAISSVASAQYLTAGVVYGFETPALSNNSAAFGGSSAITSAGLSASQPFYFASSSTTGAGITTLNASYDAPLLGIPEGRQYAFIETATTSAPSVINTTASGLSAGAQYYIDFYWTIRATTALPPFATDLFVTVDGVRVFDHFITYQVPWSRAVTATFLAQSSGSASIVFGNSISSVTDQSILLDRIVLVSGSAPGLLLNNISTGSFEYPSTTTYLYGGSITSAQDSYNNPWSFGLLTGNDAGICAASFTPILVTGPPDGSQWAFIQSKSTTVASEISTLAVSLTSGSQYYLDFWYAIRNHNTIASNSSITLNITVNNIVVFTSVISSFIPWTKTTSRSFVADSLGTARIYFTHFDSTTTDMSIIVDQVVVRPITYVALTSQYSSPVGVLNSFESPVLTPTYIYGANSQLSGLPNALTPWTLFTSQYYLGAGLARLTSAWDPPPPASGAFVPDGNQYVFIQTSGFINTSFFSGNFSGMTVGQQYYLTFFYGVRNQLDSLYHQSFQLLVNGQSVFSVDLTAPIGWTAVNSSVFTAQTSLMTAVFLVTDFNADDHAVVIDAVQLLSGSSAVVVASSSTGTSQTTSVTSSSLAATVTAAASMIPGYIYGFESPIIPSSSYVFGGNTLITSATPSQINPFWFSSSTTSGTGIAAKGTAFDSSFGSIPEGNQYAFIECATTNVPIALYANASGLSGGSYYLDFFWAISNASAITTAFSLDFTVVVNGVTVFDHTASSPVAWGRAVTAPFTPSSGSVSIRFSNTESNIAAAILLDSVVLRAGTPPGLLVNNVTTGSFEYPSVGNYAYGGNLLQYQMTSIVPWSLGLSISSSPTIGAGIGANGGSFDPAVHIVPDGIQYAFIQCKSTYVATEISSLAINLTPNGQYYLEFWFALRKSTTVDTAHDMTLYVRVNNAVVFTGLITVNQPWLRATTALFNADSLGTARVFFTNNDYALVDESIVVDAITLRPAGYQPPNANVNHVTSAVGVLNSFESPVITTTTYSYAWSPLLSPLPTSSTPWLLAGPYTVGAGIGVAHGSFDPFPGNVSAPDGNQYAFIQTTAVIQSASISANFSTLVVGQPYRISFWYGVRNQVDVSMAQSLRVLVNGLSVFLVNMTTPIAWTATTTDTFIAASTTVNVVFLVTDYNQDDHSVTLDAIKLVSVSGVLASSTGGSSSNGGSGGLSDGAIAGIVIGVVFGVLILCAIIFCLCFMTRRSSKPQKMNDSETPNDVELSQQSAPVSQVN